MPKSEYDLICDEFYTLMHTCTTLWGGSNVQLDKFIVRASDRVQHTTHRYDIFVENNHILYLSASGFSWKSTEYATKLGILVSSNTSTRIVKTNEFIQYLIDLSMRQTTIMS